MITSADATSCSTPEAGNIAAYSHADPSHVGAAIQNDSSILGCDPFARFNAQYVLHNDLALIPELSEEIQNAVNRAYGGYDESYGCQLEVSLGEAFTNGIVHGNLEIPSSTRNSPVYEVMVTTRPLRKPYRDRRVYIEVQLDREQLIVHVRDEGPGFDVASVPDPTARENLEKAFGRGLAMMRHFMDAVVHTERGNAVTLIKRAPRAV